MNRIQAYLIVQKGLEEEKVFSLNDRVTIGRETGNDICLTNRTVSRKHALVYRIKDQVIIEDLGGYNGTFVNGKRIKKTVLSSGDTLQMGKVILRFLMAFSFSDG